MLWRATCFAWLRCWRALLWLAGCKMTDAMAVQVIIYLTESDSWHHRPLHLEILKYLREEKVYGAVAFHAIAGFLGRGRIHTAHLVEAAANCRSFSASWILTSMSPTCYHFCGRWLRIG